MPDFTRAVLAPPEILDLRRTDKTTTGHLEARSASQSWGIGIDDASSDGMRFTGYAARFGEESGDLGGFRETVNPVAFDKSLSEQRAVKMFWNHDQNRPLGSTRAASGRGLLQLRKDPRGLLSEVHLPDTSDGRDMAELVRTGIVDSMSFGFTAIRDAWSGASSRELLEVRIWEVSPVTGWPAYAGTTASVRSLAPAQDASPLERALAALGRGEELNPEQHELIVRALRRGEPATSAPTLAAYRARFALL